METTQKNFYECIIIGAGFAGLSVASSLQHQNITDIILFNSKTSCGKPWMERYERLHLHTVAKESEFFGYPFPPEYGAYASREQFANYLDNSAKKMKLNIKHNHLVTKIEKYSNQQQQHQQMKKISWKISVQNNNLTSTDNTLSSSASCSYYYCNNLIVAVGVFDQNMPKMPKYEGMKSFIENRGRKRLIHAVNYSSTKTLGWKGLKVLVVGYGNTGSEIALDVIEGGGYPTSLIRSPIRLINREDYGRFRNMPYHPILKQILPYDPYTNKLPEYIWKYFCQFFDMISYIVTRYRYGSIVDKHGIQIDKVGPIMGLEYEHVGPPLMDLGTMEKINDGECKVITSNITRLNATGVEFENGTVKEFDAIVFATGYIAFTNFFNVFGKEMINEIGIENIINAGTTGHKVKDSNHLWISFGGLPMMRHQAIVIVDEIVKSDNYKNSNKDGMKKNVTRKRSSL
tara:strand:+ start:2557 stop:3930 length:1374 start_codon:yes stop_codon:yes gene_type:complete